MPELSRLAELITATRAHFINTIVPLWQHQGWNPQLALPFEALDAQHQPLPSQRYRAMACARQLYLFASLPQVPGAQAHAAALFRALQRHFHDAEQGGWFYSIDSNGQPLDRRKDLYTHAFIVFACAHYWGSSADPLAESVLKAALEVIATRFATGDGLYEAVLTQDWLTLKSGPLQNPLMHLAEAFLATLQVRQDPATQTALIALCQAMQRRFVDSKTGLLLEKPLGSADNWFEPGHQFEWLYLLETSELLHGSPLHRSMQMAFSKAEAWGVQEGHVLSMLNLDGSVRDATQRIWAQAEYLRALTLRPDAQQRVEQQLVTLREGFLHAGGWYECRDALGDVSRHDMPSTTPYHLATCYGSFAHWVE